MPGPVERWLGTFMCKQYADLFEAYGFKTLHSVCQLQLSTLHSMGIPPEHCDKILENVCVLRQSLVASSPEHMSSHDSSLPYGLRHNLQSPHYTGNVGSGYSEHDYDPQLSGHSQGSNYSYHPSPGYPPPPPLPPSHQQYANSGGQMMYPNNESYSGSQVHYSSPSHQEVYSQPLYNSRLHAAHGAWDDPMSVYNHPSTRHVMSSGLSPSASMMRSPPPPLPPPPSQSSSASVPHYPRHIIMESLPPSAHHHSWSAQGQMLSPRATPSPGMARPTSSLSSPSLANCSPAHNSNKPFSPPPYSPHPPPAHQQHSPATYSDYPPAAPAQSPAPSVGPPSRPISRPSSSVSSSSPSDPLLSLQKMVSLDSPNLRSVTRQMNNPPAHQHREDDDVEVDVLKTSSSSSSAVLNKVGPKFSSVEQLASPSPSSSSVRTTTASQKSSNVGTPSPPSVAPCGDDSNDDGSSSITAITKVRTGGGDDVVEVIDDNSLLDVVGHDNNNANDDLKTSTKVGPFRGRKKEVIRQQQQQQQQQQNGCLSPLNDGVESETSKVIANGIMSEDGYDGLKPSYRQPRTGVGKTRRKQCLSMYVRSPSPPSSSSASVSVSGFYTSGNNLYSDDVDGGGGGGIELNSFKMNGNGDNEKVELTELKTVKRFATGDQGKLLSVTSALEIVRNCDRSPPSTPPQSEVQCCPRTDTIKLEGGGVVGRYQRRASIVQPSFVSSVGPTRVLEVDVNGSSGCGVSGGGGVASKTVIITSPTSVLNSARVSVLKQGSQLGASFKMESPHMTCQTSTTTSSASSTVTVTDVSNLSAEERDALMKPRRGRPPGSKNKPKPPGFEKEPRKTVKQKAIVIANVNNVISNVIVVDTPLTATTITTHQPEVNSQNQNKPVDIVPTVNIARKPQPEVLAPSSARPRGPYIRLSGRNRNCPTSVALVNVVAKDEDAFDSKGIGTGSWINRGRGGRAICRKWPPPPIDVDGRSAQLKKKMTNVGFNSTMSANYDMFTKDKTWVCSLCKKGSHYKGLGDLFGPYFGHGGFAKQSDLATGVAKKNRVTVDDLGDGDDDDDDDVPLSRKVRAKRKRSELVEDFIKSTMAKKGKRTRELHPRTPTKLSQSADAVGTSNANPNVVMTIGGHHRHLIPSSSSVDSEDEFWVHEDCIVWSHGVHLLGPRVIGLNDAISEASRHLCVKCHESGATVGCLYKGCLEQYHYICAIEKDCQLDEEKFTIFCAKHRRKPVPSFT